MGSCRKRSSADDSGYGCYGSLFVGNIEEFHPKEAKVEFGRIMILLAVDRASALKRGKKGEGMQTIGRRDPKTSFLILICHIPLSGRQKSKYCLIK